LPDRYLMTARVGEQSEQLAIVVDGDHRYTEAYAVQIVSA
jgi:hypothetical protein